MVRTTIACARCRRYKVKCMHSGNPPCQGCIRAGSEVCSTCILSRPAVTRKKRHRPIGAHNAPPDASPPQHRTVNSSQVDVSPARSEHDSVLPPHRARDDCAIDPELVLRAGNVFNEKFPEIPFLHMSSFRKSLRLLDRDADAGTGLSGAHNQSRFGPASALYAALIAVTLPIIEPSVKADEYAALAKQLVSADDAGDISQVQALIVLAIYEWGSGKPYQAWIYSGMAIRLVQLIGSITDREKTTELQQVIYNRTFWSCFVLDRLVFCGKPQPPALPLSLIDTHWPSGDVDFAFGTLGRKIFPENNCVQSSMTAVEDIDGYFALLVQGIDIWSDIFKWVVNGGRRQSYAVTSKELPWSAGSYWGVTYKRLQLWRQRHGGRIRFPDGSVDGHVSLRGGAGEAFAYINLIYHVSMLFLGREYIPFLPTPTSRPSGPVDPPLLNKAAPSQWWEDRANELFSASSNITALLNELRTEGAPLLTPFAGFCAFSAATMNIYVVCFPEMNLGRSRGKEANFDMDLIYLDEFRARWPMGAGWWVTLEKIKDLYRRASADGSRYAGKTQADFVHLLTSIHDCTGASPEDGDENPRSKTRGLTKLGHPSSEDHQAAMSLQQVSQSRTLDDAALQAAQMIPDWNELWSLWGDPQMAAFGVEENSYEYSFEIL
ncbi:fungal specific transcription factor, putative [Talaromyces stipitatus ATCC 10500]|uniref:Fungal specific transcription factor, putative n=1 Tax=Talaromyces stipitatus (strain ATCC 10500 / CBS 375.48 / QM 6759 / NRRL 1006) TaxID=441959 RepID=B8MCG2_TALSN|nr:fungal specific transcription factor, putative [Talaromyces stipitatus ATCC 10500]EED18778.1 fungal specific transcription factor, putative [Talaromyces stipitatus ATCC 10500]